MKNYEQDIDRITSDKDMEGIYYQTITGLSQVLSGPPDAAAVCTQQRQQRDPKETAYEELSSNTALQTNNPVESGTDTETGEENTSDSAGNAGSASETETKGPPIDKRAARKENKKKVKEEKREARKTKVPKAVKKRNNKKARGKYRKV